MPSDKDREEARNICEIIAKEFFTRGSDDEVGFGEMPIEIVAKEIERVKNSYRLDAYTTDLKREIDLCYSMWTGRDYMHLPLHEALGKAIADRETDTLREAAERAVNWWNQDREDGGPDDLRAAILSANPSPDEGGARDDEPAEKGE